MKKRHVYFAGIIVLSGIIAISAVTRLNSKKLIKGKARNLQTLNVNEVKKEINQGKPSISNKTLRAQNQSDHKIALKNNHTNQANNVLKQQKQKPVTTQPRFPNRKVIISEETELADGIILKESIVEVTDFKYSKLKIIEKIDSETKQVLSSREMAADHFLLKVNNDITEEELNNQLAGTELSILKQIPNSNIYLINCPSDYLSSLDESIEFTKRNEYITKLAEPDYIRHQTAIYPNDSKYGELWGMDIIQAPQAWEYTTGSSNITVGVIDTGIDFDHPDLKQNMWHNTGEDWNSDGTPGYNGIDDDNNGYADDYYGIDAYNGDSSPMDDMSHGTHCAGTIGGVGNNNLGVAGVNWNVKLMGLKFLSRSGSGSNGTDSDAIECINYAKLMGANLTSNSWGGVDYNSLLADAIEESQSLFVVSAGNSSSDNDLYPVYPSSYDAENILSVAATGNNYAAYLGENPSSDVLAGFSCYGKTSVDIGAPGVQTLSTIPEGEYGYKSGTSMAGPHVAGAAALLLSLDSDLTALELKDLLTKTVDYKDSLKDKCTSEGRLNLLTAVKYLSNEPIIKINYPFAETNLFKDESASLNIKWISSTVSSNVNIELLNNNVKVLTIAENISNTGEYTWTYPDSLEISKNYQIKISDSASPTTNSITGNFGIYDSSSYYNENIGPHSFIKSGTAQGWIGDDEYHELQLPFKFPFYGKEYDSVWVSINGFLDFSDGKINKSYNNLDQVLINSTMIAPLWTDLITNIQGETGYDIFIHQPDNNSICIRWHAGTYNNQEEGVVNPVNFEVILTKDGKIQFNYGQGNKYINPTIGISAGNGYQYDISKNYNRKDELNLADSVTFTPKEFSDEKYEINFSTDSNGYLTGEISQIIQYGKQSSPVTAMPNDGYLFKNWSGDYSGNNNPLILSGIIRNMTVQANFIKESYNVEFISPTHGEIIEMSQLSPIEIDVKATDSADNEVTSIISVDQKTYTGNTISWTPSAFGQFEITAQALNDTDEKYSKTITLIVKEKKSTVDITADYSNASPWWSTVSITIKNNGTQAITGSRLEFDFPYTVWYFSGAQIISRNNNHYVLQANTIYPGSSVTISGGFSAGGRTPDTEKLPKTFILDGKVIGGENNPPIAIDDSSSVTAGESVTINVLSNDSDPDGDSLSITSFSAPSKGSVRQSGNSLIYTASSNASGTDSFQYTISDSSGETDTANVTVTIYPKVNTPPTVSITSPANGTVISQKELSPVTISIEADDSDGTVISSKITVDGKVFNSSSVSWLPSAFGNFTIKAEATDNDGATASATSTVEIREIKNNPPIANDDSLEITAGEITNIDVLINDRDPDGDSLTITAVCCENEFGKPEIVNEKIKYTAKSAGSHTVTYTISDNKGGTDEANIFITINDKPNNPPVVADDTAEVTAGNTVIINALANDSDPEGGKLSITDVCCPEKGSAVISGCGSECFIIYTADAEASGSDAFTYTVADDKGATAEGKITVTINDKPNNPPVAANDTAKVKVGNSVIIDVLANDSDIDGDELSISKICCESSYGTPEIINNKVKYSAKSAGTHVFTYTVSDGKGGNDDATVTVTIEKEVVQQNVVIKADYTNSSIWWNGLDIEITNNSSEAINGWELEFDFPYSIGYFNGAVRKSKVGNHYTLVPNSWGSGKYISPGSTVKISGGFSLSGNSLDQSILPQTFIFNGEQIGGDNNPPIAKDDNAELSAGESVTINVLENDNDPDGDILMISEVTQGTKGTVEITGCSTECQIIYTAYSDEEGTDSFTYTINDGNNGTDTATVSVVITSTYTDLVAIDDYAQVEKGNSVDIDVLANDQAADIDVITIEGITVYPENGTAVIEDEYIIYTPDPDFTGKDSFKYIISDGIELSDEATVSVSVTEVGIGNQLLVDNIFGELNITTPDLGFHTIEDGNSLPISSIYSNGEYTFEEWLIDGCAKLANSTDYRNNNVSLNCNSNYAMSVDNSSNTNRMNEEEYNKLVESLRKSVELGTKNTYNDYQLKRNKAQFKATSISLVKPNLTQSSEAEVINSEVSKLLIVVNAELYNEVSDRVERYAKDISTNFNCNIVMEKVSGGNAENIKAIIQNHKNNLSGAVFIGNIPAAFFEIDNDFYKYGYKNWPCDLYFMDLDGQWIDSDNNGIYDLHTGNTDPEIFVGRIDTSPMGYFGNEVELMKKYLDKNHNYWISGKNTIPAKTLNYCNRDWNSSKDLNQASGLLFNIAKNVSYRSEYDSEFSPYHYTELLKADNFGFIQLACHSAYYYHAFDNGYLEPPEIWNSKPKATGYNLFCCSGCLWTADKRYFLGGAYVYNESPNAMVAVGSSKTGSMLDFRYFYHPLRMGNTVGTAFKKWFKKARRNWLPYRDSFLSWCYGMTIVGDPMVKFKPQSTDNSVLALYFK